MRTIVMLAAMLAALAMAPQPAEAGDRGFGFRHFSPHAGAKFHRPHHRFDSDRRDFFGKHRHFKPRHFARPGFVLEFSDENFAFKFGHVPRFKPRHFHHRHGRSVHLRFGRPWQVHPWHHRGLAFGQHRHGIPRNPGGVGGDWRPDSDRGGAMRHMPSQGILEQLRALGFREVPRLLEERGQLARFR